MDADRDKQGVEMYCKVFGKDPGADRTGLRMMTIEHLFGEVWTLPSLEPRLRSLITIAILAADGRGTELMEHLRGALHLGWSKDELLEAMIHVAHYAGWPAGHSGQAALLRALDPDEQVLRELAGRIAEAETRGDRAFFEDLLHERFIFRRATAEFNDKKQFLDSLAASSERHVEVKAVDLLGKYRAVVKSVV